MKMIVTARHCDIPDDLRDRATELVEKVAKLAVRPHRAEIIFDDDHQRKIVELQLYLVGGQVMRESWAMVFPSAKEGWGITNVEAAACGTLARARTARSTPI